MKNRTYETNRNRNYDGHQKTSSSMVHKLFNKKTGSRVCVNEQLAEELYK